MATDFKPMTWNWSPIVTGCTYPATNLTDTAADTDLVRVVVLIEPHGSDTASLTLDSDDTGVTINTATAGAWDYTIDEISDTDMATLTPGFYTINLTTTDSAGTVLCEFKGEWEILEK